VIRILTCWFLTVILFFGNVGIALYTHVCEEEGSFTSLFIPDNSHCEKELSELPACCQKKQKQDCCHNETKVFKVQSDYSTSCLKLIFHTPYLVAEEHFFELNFNPTFINEKSLAFSGTDPPPLLYGRKILIRNQVFRI
jgi:hypothetical protein